MKLGLIKLPLKEKTLISSLRRDANIKVVRARFIEDTKCIYTGQWREPNLQTTKNETSLYATDFKENEEVENNLENLIEKQ